MDGMDVLILALLVLIAVLVSSVLSEFLPKISTPLVQIGLGVVWYFTPFLPNIKLDPDLFMTLFIAPLFYIESRNMNRAVLARDVRLSLSLAVGLVMVSMFASGFVLHAMWPAVTLVIAFAVGAILSPTDAVSVSQLGEQVELTERQRSILQSESLLNDPVSIVGFSTAMLALGSGTFSPVGFTAGVIWNFVAGTGIGVVVGLLFNRLVIMMRTHGLENTTTRIMMEIFLPFGAYVVAERCGVSGLLSVVAAGLVITFPNKGMGGDIARTNLVSNSVWEFLDFALNGAVFVLLGIELPIAMRETLDHHAVNPWLLVAIVAALTAIMLGLRFVWCLVMLKYTRDEKTHELRPMTKARWHSVWVMTFGGPKGAISLAMALTIPYSVNQPTGLPVRSSILFIVSGFIIVSLLMTNVALPLLSPKTGASSGEEFVRKNMEMLRRTIAKIAELDDTEHHAAVGATLRSYNERIERQRREVPRDDLEERRDLRLDALGWEREWLARHLADLHVKLEHGADIEVEAEVTESMLGHIEDVERKLDMERSAGRGIGFRAAAFRRNLMPALRRLWSGVARRTPLLDASHVMATQHVQVPMYTEMIVKLRRVMQSGRYDAEVVSELMVEYRRALRLMRAKMDTIVTSSDHMGRVAEEVRAQALRLELATIREMLEAHEITKDDARIMRGNVTVIQADAVL